MSRPDFSRAYRKANEILVSSSVITTFPYSVKELIKEKSGIHCRSYSLARKRGVDMTAFGSESAVVVQFNGKVIIFYDDRKPETHIRFSMLHEFGHVVNGHDFSWTSTETYQQYELETNYFSAQLLMPEQVLREIQMRGIHISLPFLQEHFGVSKQAAEKRIATLAKTNAEWRSRAEKEFDDIIVMKYHSFISQVAPSRSFSERIEEDIELERERQMRLSYL